MKKIILVLLLLLSMILLAACKKKPYEFTTVNFVSSYSDELFPIKSHISMLISEIYTLFIPFKFIMYSILVI